MECRNLPSQITMWLYHLYSLYIIIVHKCEISWISFLTHSCDSLLTWSGREYRYRYIYIYIMYIIYIYPYCSLISPSPLQPLSFVYLVIFPSQTGWSNRSGAGLGGSSWRRRCRDRVNSYALSETHIILWIILWIYCTINILIWWYISGWKWATPL